MGTLTVLKLLPQTPVQGCSDGSEIPSYVNSTIGYFTTMCQCS